MRSQPNPPPSHCPPHYRLNRASPVGIQDYASPPSDGARGSDASVDRSSSEVSEPPRARLPNGNMECKHICQNKPKCRHGCCRDGIESPVTLKRRRVELQRRNQQRIGEFFEERLRRGNTNLQTKTGARFRSPYDARVRVNTTKNGEGNHNQFKAVRIN